MAHSAVKPIWKFSWKPEGYGIQDVILNTSKKTLNTLVSFKGSYFRGKEFAANLKESGNSLTIGYEDRTLLGTEDIILRMLEPKLSQLGNSGVYRMIELATKRTLNTEILLKINFIADAMNPEDFNQDPHLEAHVVHKSLTATSVVTGTLSTGTLNISKGLSGNWGELSEKGITSKGSTLKIGEDTFSEGSLTTKKSLYFECNSLEKKGKLRYNKDNLLWEIWNPRSKKMVPIITSHVTADKIPLGGIPVIDPNDATSLSFVDWFNVDLEKKSLSVKNIEAGPLKASGKEVVIAGGTTLILGEHTFKDFEGTLTIDNILQIDKKKERLSIGGVVFDRDLVIFIRDLQTRLAALELKTKDI